MLNQYSDYGCDNKGDDYDVLISVPSCSATSANSSFETNNDVTSRDVSVSNESDNELPVQTPVVRRSGRSIKPPDRLNL